MKKNRMARLGRAACLTLGMTLLPMAGAGMDVQAAEVVATVQGKVMDKTTSKLLYLDTPEGKMEIKIDGETNTGGCKVLLPNKEISVSVSNGSDGYLHAVTISEEAAEPAVTLDTSNISSVVGTLNEKTTESVLHMDTAQGEMELKLDKNTDMSGCSVLVVSGKYVVRCARGDDAYMHAISIADVAQAPASTYTAPTNYQAPVVNVDGTTKTVTGTVKDSTDETTLCLAASEGDLKIKIYDGTDTSRGMILTPDNKLMVTYFRSTDNNYYAASIVGVKDSSSATVDTSSQATVTGTVKSKSTENILVLDTSAGEMELKLDRVSSINGCKVLVKDKKVSVTCSRGDDAYMHALAVAAVVSADNPSNSTVNYTPSYTPNYTTNYTNDTSGDVG